MKRLRVWAFGAAAAALMAALWTPERAPAYSPPATHTPFTWGQDALWARLERRFDAARMRDCEDLGPTIDAGLAGLDLSLERLAERPLRPDAPLLRMLESQLFGHEKGAFTGAERSRQGLFSMADGGTLFLDELGNLSLPLQAKLLRALQERAVVPVGGSEPVPFRARLLTATNADLQKDVDAKEAEVPGLSSQRE